MQINDQELFRLVQEKAYSFYIERGYSNGDDQADWYRAEREVLKSLKKK